MTKVVLLGAGYASVKVARSIAATDGLDVAAFVDPVIERAQARVKDFGGTAVRQLQNLEMRAEIAIVCTPPASHISVAVKALGAGMHVLVEKPLCVNLKEIEDLESAQRNSGRLCGAIAQWRYSEPVRQLWRAIRAGELGRVKSAKILVRRRRTSDYFHEAVGGWRLDASQSGGGVLATIGFHSIDLLCWILGGAPKAKVCRVERLDGVDMKVHGSFFIGDVLCTVDSAWGDVEEHPDSLYLETDVARVVVRGGVWVGHQPDKIESFTLHGLQIADFVKAVSRGEPAPVTPRDVEPALQIIRDLYALS